MSGEIPWASSNLRSPEGSIPGCEVMGPICHSLLLHTKHKFIVNYGPWEYNNLAAISISKSSVPRSETRLVSWSLITRRIRKREKLFLALNGFMQLLWIHKDRFLLPVQQTQAKTSAEWIRHFLCTLLLIDNQGKNVKVDRSPEVQKLTYHHVIKSSCAIFQFIKLHHAYSLN